MKKRFISLDIHKAVPVRFTKFLRDWGTYELDIFLFSIKLKMKRVGKIYKIILKRVLKITHLKDGGKHKNKD